MTSLNHILRVRFREDAPAEPGRLAKLLLAFASVYLIWGSTYLAIRVALESFPPFVLMGVRSVAAGGVLYLWARWRGATVPDYPRWQGAAICGALLFLVGHGGLAWAQERVTSGVAALLWTTQPFWMLLLGWQFAGEDKPARTTVAGLALGVFGLGMLVRPTHTQGEVGLDPLAVTVIVVASLAWACGSLFSRTTRLPRSPVVSSGMQLLSGGGLLLAAALATGEGQHLANSSITLNSLAALGFLIVFGSIVTFSAYVWLLRAVSPAQASTHTFVNPIVAVILGWAFLGEPLTLNTVVASAVIVVGVALVVLRAPRKPLPTMESHKGGENKT